MPIIFQQQPDQWLQLAVWHITEPLSFFEQQLTAPTAMSHPQVRSRHLAARHLLTQLCPGLSMDQLVVAPSGKPGVADGSFDFSLSHCGDYAAAIVSHRGAVGVDLELPGERIFRIRHKFLSDQEQELLQRTTGLPHLQEGDAAACWLTRCWSAKESVFKWQGQHGIVFNEQIQLSAIDESSSCLHVLFTPTGQSLKVYYRSLQGLELTWVEPPQ